MPGGIRAFVALAASFTLAACSSSSGSTTGGSSTGRSTSTSSTSGTSGTSTTGTSGTSSTSATSGTSSSSGSSGATCPSLDWVQLYPDAEPGSVTSVNHDPSGGLIAAFDNNGTPADLGQGPLNIDAGGAAINSPVILRVDAQGNTTWSTVIREGDVVGCNGQDVAGSGSRVGVAAGASGSILLAGAFNGLLDLGTGPLIQGLQGLDNPQVAGGDLCRMSFSPSGSLNWAQCAGPGVADAGSSEFDCPEWGSFRRQLVVATSAGSVLFGDFAWPADLGNGQVVAPSGPAGLLAGFSASGDAQWSHVFSRFNQFALTALSDGSVVIGGDYVPNAGTLAGQSLPPVPDGGGGNAFLARFDASGNLVWGKGLPDSVGTDSIIDAVTSPDGDVVASGFFFGDTLDLGAGPMHSAPYYGAGESYFVSKFDANGSAVWSRALSGAKFTNFADFASHSSVGPDGRITLDVRSDGTDLGLGAQAAGEQLLRYGADGTLECDFAPLPNLQSRLYGTEAFTGDGSGGVFLLGAVQPGDSIGSKTCNGASICFFIAHFR